MPHNIYLDKVHYITSRRLCLYLYTNNIHITFMDKYEILIPYCLLTKKIHYAHL